MFVMKRYKEVNDSCYEKHNQSKAIQWNIHELYVTLRAVQRQLFRCPEIRNMNVHVFAQ